LALHAVVAAVAHRIDEAPAFRFAFGDVLAGSTSGGLLKPLFLDPTPQPTRSTMAGVERQAPAPMGPHAGAATRVVFWPRTVDRTDRSLSNHDLNRRRTGAGEDRGDREVIALYLDGDSRAFENVEAWIRTEIRNGFPVLRDEADDLTQGIHAKLVKALREDRFRHRSSLKTYVVRLARYTCVDRIRARHRAPLFHSRDETDAHTGDPSRSSPYRRLFRAERHALLLQIVMHAPETCRDLWRLAYVEQLSYQEIGRRLSLPPGTIKSRMWACRKQALRLLERLGSGNAAERSEER
jgi:RNA polymerase sigma-70 factor (ECF subfamily)